VKEKKMIPLNKIVVENIDPFLGGNQIIDVSTFHELNIVVTFYYHDKKDCLMVKVEQDSTLVFEQMGSRLTYNSIVQMIKEVSEDHGISWVEEESE
jgi:hypothetical protein